jgi:protein tyrosine phosphatase (PTP) superfamily phosphohydrolase (DUF442 family)
VSDALSRGDPKRLVTDGDSDSSEKPGTIPLSWQTVDEICNYLRISESLGTGGQPLPEQFAAIKGAGYELVVNLAMPTSTNALLNERELVIEQGMDYVHIPVVWEAPTERDLERFFEVMDENRGRKIFAHCALNMRVSVFVLLYRVLRQGVPLHIAQEALHRIWQPDGVWQDLMDNALSRHDRTGGL